MLIESLVYIIKNMCVRMQTSMTNELESFKSESKLELITQNKTVMFIM